MIANIFSDHVDRGVSVVLLHLEQVGVLATRLGKKPGAQRMPGKVAVIVAGSFGGSLYHQRDALRAHCLVSQPALRGKLAKHRVVLDPGNVEPGAVLAHRRQALAIRDRDDLALALLIGL